MQVSLAKTPARLLLRNNTWPCWLSLYHIKCWPHDRPPSDQETICLPYFFSYFFSNNVSFLPNSLFLGFHFNCTPKPASLSQTPMRSAPPSFLPFRTSGPPLLGGCEAPVVSLAEAQQELQMLQKQLGERSEHCCLGVLMRGGPHSVALHGFGWMGVKGKLGTRPRWQMEGKLARFLSEMRLLLSLECVPSATGRIQTLFDLVLKDC